MDAWRLFATPFPQLPGESSLDYMKRLSAIASDPKLFEESVLRASTGVEESTNTTNNSSSFAEPTMTTTEKKKKRGYVRAEEWDQERNAKAQEEGMSWEERVQYDGQRFGNQFQQNEILRKNLKAF